MTTTKHYEVAEHLEKAEQSLLAASGGLEGEVKRELLEIWRSVRATRGLVRREALTMVAR